MTHIRARATIAAALAALVCGTAALGPAQAADGSTQRRAPQKFKVGAKASTDELVLGKRVKIKGKVTPRRHAAGRTAVLQKRIDGRKRWKREATDRIDKRGRYSFTDRPTTVKARSYRVVVPKTAKVRRGVSKKLHVTVYRWSYLTRLVRRASESFVADRSRAGTVGTVDTVEFPHSAKGNRYATDGFIDYNLKRQCIRLRTTVGLDDDSDDTASALIEISTDGTTRYSQSFGFLQSAQTAIDLRDADGRAAFRLRFDYTVSDPADVPNRERGAIALIGSPEVLCTF